MYLLFCIFEQLADIFSGLSDMFAQDFRTILDLWRARI